MAVSDKRLSGVTLFSINGAYYDVVGDVTWTPGGWKREAMVSLSGPKGEFRETPFAGSIKVKLRDKGSLTVGDFMNMTDAVIVIEAANGKAISGYGMYCTGDIEPDVVEAAFSVVFEGSLVEESN